MVDKKSWFCPWSSARPTKSADCQLIQYEHHFWLVQVYSMLFYKATIFFIKQENLHDCFVSTFNLLNLDDTKWALNWARCELLTYQDLYLFSRVICWLVESDLFRVLQLFMFIDFSIQTPNANILSIMTYVTCQILSHLAQTTNINSASMIGNSRWLNWDEMAVVIPFVIVSVSSLHCVVVVYLFIYIYSYLLLFL